MASISFGDIPAFSIAWIHAGKAKSELAVPIIHGNRVLGVINQDSFRKNFFTQEHQKILQIISSLISSKVYNLKQIQILNEVFTPPKDEITKAKKILEEFNNSNTGLVVIDGKLIEKPVLREMKRKILIADKINKN